MAYHRYQKVDTRIVRIFNTYGPRLQLNDGRVISNFMKQALLRRGPDRLRRRLADAQLLLRQRRSCRHPGARASPTSTSPTNIGNPDEFTILECAQVVLEVTGSKSKIRYEPLPQDDPKQRCPDISKAKRLLGWEPKIDLRTGLRMSLDYFRQAVQSSGARA